MSTNNLDTTTLSSQEPTYDARKEKSELLARLDEMKKAIDGYKDYKTKAHDKTLSTSNNHCLNQTNASIQQVSKLESFRIEESMSLENTLMPTIEQAYIQTQYNSTDVNLQKYLSITTKQQEQEVQCDLYVISQQELIQKHRQELAHFESCLDVLKQELDLQGTREAKMQEQLNSVQRELEEMKQQKTEQDKREEDLMKQTEELIAIVEDQTLELRERDRTIEHLQQIEMEYYEMKNEKNMYETQTFQKENDELKEQIEDLKEKMAIEFNKKRILKQEYDDQLQDVKEELVYFKDKYYEMKDLLTGCREQLKHFEGLNEMRNTVIEKLEQELKDLKTQQVVKPSYQSLPPLYQKPMTESILTQQTPSKQPERSFSLNIQQVDCDRSNYLNNSQITSRNIYDTASKHQAQFDMGTFSEVVSPKQSSLYGMKPQQTNSGLLSCRKISQDFMETNNTMQQEYGSRAEYTGSFNSTSSITQYEQMHASKSQQALSPLSAHYQKSSYSLQCAKDKYDSFNKENSIQKHRKVDSYYERIIQSDQKYGQDRVEQDTKPFRVLSNDSNRDYKEMIIQQKRPFEYNQHSIERIDGQFHSKPESNKIHSSCTFAGQQSTDIAQNESFVDQNESINQPRMSQHKSSIRDEIKKLHNNINSLRQKMNVNKPTKNNSEMLISDSLSMKYLKSSRESSPSFDMKRQ